MSEAYECALSVNVVIRAALIDNGPPSRSLGFFPNRPGVLATSSRNHFMAFRMLAQLLQRYFHLGKVILGNTHRV